MNIAAARLLRLLVAAATVALAACAPITKVASGEAVVRERLAVTVSTPWNQFERGLGDDTPVWTTEGITVDALQFWVAVKDGQLIAPTPGQPKGVVPLAFKRGMQPADVVALYQALWTRDGSTFELEKLEPTEFLGGAGFRFEYALTRKVDDVRLRGMAWAAVRNGELFLIAFSAPRLGFYARLAPQAEAVARSARVRG